LFIKEPYGDDAVYDFLFIQKRGYCEQFASAMAVMLRSIGIPSRVVLGYLPEKKDIFTGFVEVYADDAHAWVEVLTPYGWISVDPSPSNVDEKTLVYLQRQRNVSIVSNIFGIQSETVETLLFLAKLSFSLIFILVVIFLFVVFFNVLKLNLLTKYLEKIDVDLLEEQKDKWKIRRVFLTFLDYFSLKNISFEKSLTLREIGKKDIKDPLFEKFRRLIKVLEVVSYGP